VDIELNSGEGINSLSGEDYLKNSEILYNSLIRAGFDKTSFVMGPALGTIHHAKSNNIRPDLSHDIYNLTSKNGNLGNVLHGTSFAANESIASCVENNCIRVNFAGQYLNCIVESLSEDLRHEFGSTQSERKSAFSRNKKLLDSLSTAEVTIVKESIKDLFNGHSKVLNNIILDDQSADFFYNPVSDLPDDLIQTIGRKIFRIEDTRRAKRRIKPVLLASMIEVPDGEFKAGIAKEVYNAGIKNFHIDVGDGVFINRKICGLEKIEYLKNLDSGISIHVHLMAISPHLRTIDGASLIEKYCRAGASVIYLSPESFESVEQLSIAIDLVSQNNSVPGLVFNPDSEYSDEKFEFLQKNNIHNIQLMGVFSGRGGQRFIPGVLNTVTKYRLVADEKKYSLKIEVDGGLTKEIAKLCSSAGVDFLAGWSMFLSKGVDKITNTTKELLDEI
jgi:ribulose-phosphate 3-epimerase